MSKYQINLFFLLLSVIIPITVPAAELPVLPNDGKIRSGKLGNGISYYVVTNSKGTGKIDIALVQKGGKSDEGMEEAGAAVVRARSSINELPRFVRRTPFSFMQGKSIWPGPEGYVKVSDNSTVFRFNNIRNVAGNEAVDSTLLMVFDIIGKEHKREKNVYVPENYAIIVVGDVDENAVLGKMDMLSMLVTDRRGKVPAGHYEWHETNEPEYHAVSSPYSIPASIRIDYRLPRVSEDKIATVLPLVSMRYFSELSVLLRKRLERSMRREGIPVASMDFNYFGSFAYPGDERYSITLNTDREHLIAATETIAAVLAELDIRGAVVGEYYDAVNEVVASLKRDELYGQVPNWKYIDICMSAFLYGASMASPQTQLNFFVRRKIEGAASVKLFNNFVAAILDKASNVSITCSAIDADAIGRDIVRHFSDSWDKNAVEVPYISHIVSNSDTVGFRPNSTRNKIRSVATEPVSGGLVWTFSNGIKVIYKQIPNSGDMFYYSWFLKGGYMQVPELTAGGGAYLPDMFKLYNAAGMTSERFRDMLRANGISLDTEVSASDCFIRGAAPSNRLQLTLKSLSALANTRSVDEKAFSYYRKCESLRALYSEALCVDMPVVLDSIMSPGYEYASYKRGRPDDEIQLHAEKFYSRMFSKMNNGVLIITGNLNENALKKTLSQYVGTFKTGRGTAYRSRIQNKNISGRATVYNEAPEPSIGIALSAPLNQTAENYMAGMIASSALHDAVAGSAAIYGWNTDSDWRFSMFPEETININLYLRRASSDGLPASMMPSDSSEQVLSAVRKAISGIGHNGVGDALFAAEKAELAGLFSIWTKNPVVMRTIIELRYAYGKDLMTGQAVKLKSIDKESVNRILRSLADAGVAEYVVKKNDLGAITEASLPALTFPSVPDMVPADDFTYPFGNMTVPLDTLDLKSLETIPMRYYEPDSTYVPLKRRVDSMAVKAPADTLLKKPLVDTLLKPSTDTLLKRPSVDTLNAKPSADTLTKKPVVGSLPPKEPVADTLLKKTASETSGRKRVIHNEHIDE